MSMEREAAEKNPWLQNLTTLHVNQQTLKDIEKWGNIKMRTLDEYADAASETAIYKGIGTFEGFIYNTLKLNGEAGEIADKVGKIFGQGKTPTEAQVEDFKSELGDCLWHLTMAAQDLGLGLEGVAEANVVKLRSRQKRGVIVGDGDNR